jgi:hypothetical protein
MIGITEISEAVNTKQKHLKTKLKNLKPKTQKSNKNNSEQQLD